MFLVKKIQLAICSGRFYGSIVRYIDRNLPLYRPHSNGSVAPAVSRTDQAHPSILRSDAKEHWRYISMRQNDLKWLRP